MKKYLFFGVLSLFLLVQSCDTSRKAHSYSGFYMDTVFDIKLYGSQRGDKMQLISKLAFSDIQKIENHYSVTRPESLIFRLNRDKRVVTDTEDVDLFRRIFRLSEGVNRSFDITIYPVMLAWGFTTGHYRIPTSQELGQAVAKVNEHRIKISSNEIRLTDGMKVDLGGVVKGYTVDRVCDFLEKQGVSAGLVNAGGNLKVFGTKPDGSPWIVGIRHPRNPADLYEVIPLQSGMAIATSGDYERYFMTNGIRYHHLMDPATGYPVRNGVVSVSVIHPSAETADLLSTALFVLGKERALLYAKTNHIPVLILIEGEKGLTNFQSANWPTLN